MNEVTKEKDFCDKCINCGDCPLSAEDNCYKVVEKLYEKGYEIVKKQQGYKFNIPVGDWSDDGHGKCNHYLVESNKPVEEVREAHYKIKEVIGIDLSKVCSSYGDSSLNEDDYAILKDLGFEFNSSHFDDDEDNAIVYPSGFAEMWIFLLMQVDKDLKINRISEEGTDNLTFYGFDEEGRHIGLLGYGCFYD